MISGIGKVTFFLRFHKRPANTRWGHDVILAPSELKCITSSCFIMVKNRCNVLQVVCLCVWSSRFPQHPSPWQRRTNQSPPCLFSFHHARPASSFISRPGLMKTRPEDGSSGGEMDWLRFNAGPVPCDLEPLSTVWLFPPGIYSRWTNSCAKGRTLGVNVRG